MSDWTLQARVQAFLYEYAASLDEERFDDWVALFEPGNCTYEVLSRENRDLGLPAPIMGCYSYGMVCDRVAMLVKGVLTYRHNHLLRQVSNVRVRRAAPESKDDALLVQAGLVVHQSDEEGVSSLYMVGRYEMQLTDVGGKHLIRRMEVVVDSFGIDTMLAVPL
ncbi:MAG: nuclear transport factor 2 family protein [Proteobacteria bacterium]|nr:nuclear transport factor 2 family protein [Pseudomonadota bacterium]